MPSRKKAVKITILPERVKEKRYAFDTGNKHIKAEFICRYCNAVYEEKHWKPFMKLNPAHIDKLTKTVCPACHEQRAHVSDGVLHITGSFLQNHSKEIMGIILNTEAREGQRNILNRIERIETRPDSITVYTSKNQLAAEIGKKIDNAYKQGKLTIKWSRSGNDKIAEVFWHKDTTDLLT